MFQLTKEELNIDVLEEDAMFIGESRRFYAVSYTHLIVKLLNPNIMKRPTAMNNFNTADKLEEILKITILMQYIH